MGRATWKYEQQEKERVARKQIHPLWRGVGCIMIILLGGTGYLFAEWFLAANQVSGWLPIPVEVLRVPFAPWLPAGLVFKLGVALIFMIVSYGLVSILYAILFPPQLGEHDVPPLKRRPRRRR
jgi:nicotinamide riboside transporter PnuC